MSDAAIVDAGDRETQPRAPGLMVATVALGSFLLFMVEPMVARMALPRLGGSPAVWSSAVLVYQTLLLAGYAWAHVTSGLKPRTQAVAHLVLLAVAAAWLPIGLSAGQPASALDPAIWTPYLIAISIGPLFLAMAAQATLLQRWLAVRGGNPYPLYAASNAGSMAGLLLYPFLIEPLSSLAAQRLGWSIGYMSLALLTAACATRLPRRGHGDAAPRSASPGWPAYLRWILLAAIPSGLMLSTTTVITTDLAAGPLLWVLPLAVYLASYIAAFSARDQLIASAMRVAPLLLLVSSGLAMMPQGTIPAVAVLMGLGTLYAISVAIHGRLYRERPAADRLSVFYLCLALGGVVGGAFSALYAPIAFDWTWEHLILLALASLAFAHQPLLDMRPLSMRVGVPLAVATAVLAPLTWWSTLPVAIGATVAIIAIGIVCAVAVGRRSVTTVALAALLFVQAGWGAVAGRSVGLRMRSYFGITRVVDVGDYRIMLHGTTAHGAERIRPAISTEPISYYAATSGIGRALSAVPSLYGPAARIDVVGLGTGTLACWAKPGQIWTFHEIDPDMVWIARDSGLFHYVPRCRPDARMVIGDARVNLASQAAGSVDLIALDAFTSDAIPIHLVTREAFATYDRVVGPRGVVVAHISNRHLDLEPVLAAMRDRHAIVLDDVRPKGSDPQVRQSIWVALSHDPAVIARIAATDPRWRPVRRREGFAGWSDDHASILPVLRF